MKVESWPGRKKEGAGCRWRRGRRSVNKPCLCFRPCRRLPRYCLGAGECLQFAVQVFEYCQENSQLLNGSVNRENDVPRCLHRATVRTSKSFGGWIVGGLLVAGQSAHQVNSSHQLSTQWKPTS